MASVKPAGVDVMVCYSHLDARVRKRLEFHLAMLKREGLVSVWHDKKITAGKEWEREIEKRLEGSRVFLLLVSEYFLASDYCFGTEMKRALERHDAGEARVVPVIVSQCDWKVTPLQRLEAVPEDGKPILDWRPQRNGYADASTKIRRVIEEVVGKASDPGQDGAQGPANGPVGGVEAPAPQRAARGAPATGPYRGREAAILLEVLGHQATLIRVLDEAMPAYLVRKVNEAHLSTIAPIGRFRTDNYETFRVDLIQAPEAGFIVQYYEALRGLNALSSATVTKYVVLECMHALEGTMHVVDGILALDGVEAALSPELRERLDADRRYRWRMELLLALGRTDYRSLKTLDRHEQLKELAESMPGFSRDLSEAADTIARLPEAVRDDPKQRWRPYLLAAEPLAHGHP